jgi:hypothetical protein
VAEIVDAAAGHERHDDAARASDADRPAHRRLQSAVSGDRAGVFCAVFAQGDCRHANAMTWQTVRAKCRRGEDDLPILRHFVAPVRKRSKRAAKEAVDAFWIVDCTSVSTACAVDGRPPARIRWVPAIARCHVATMKAVVFQATGRLRARPDRRGVRSVQPSA